jgi:prepilin-type N-terminal cleavage/methylation domain-containing protein
MRKQGFTLVEIMIVVAIIGLLTAIAIPAFIQYRNDTRTGLCVNNLRLIRHAKEVVGIKENLAQTATPNSTQVWTYVDGGQPVCPESGTYSVNALNADPACTFGGEHTI